MDISALNAHRFKYNFITRPTCETCHSGSETPHHHFFICPAHEIAHQKMLDKLVGELGINTNNKTMLLHTILHGTYSTVTNKHIIDITLEYMITTERFK